MIPTTDFLVRLFAQIHFVANVPNVAHCDGVCLALDGNIDNRTADLVFHVANNGAMVCFHSRLGTHQLAVAPRPMGTRFLLAADGGGNACQSFGVALYLMATFAAGNDRRFVFIAHNRRVNLAQVYADNVGAAGLFGYLSILGHNSQL